MKQIGDGITDDDFGVIIFSEEGAVVINTSRHLSPLEIQQALIGLLLLLGPNDRQDIFKQALNNINSNDLQFDENIMM